MANLEYILKVIDQSAAVDTATSRVRQFDSVMDGAISRTKSFGGGLMSAAASGAFAFNNIINAGKTLFDMFAKPVQVAMDAEKARVSFEVMLGSAEAADTMIKNLKEDAAKTPFEFADLQQGANTLINFGIEANKVRGYMLQLGDVAAGDAEKFKSLSLVFGQVASAGKLQGQDLMQLINQGFNPLQEISRTTGKSMAQLKQEMEKGQISFDMVTAAFESATSEGGRFNGMMDKMSQTTAGKLSTLQDNFTENILKPFGEMMIPAVNAAMDSIASLIERAQPYLQGFFSTIATTATNIYNAFAPVFLEIWAVLEPVFQALYEAFSGVGAQGGTLMTIVEMVAERMHMLVPVLEAAIKLLGWIANTVIWLTQKIYAFLEAIGLFDWVNGMVQQMADSFVWAVDSIEEFIDSIREALEWLGMLDESVKKIEKASISTNVETTQSAAKALDTVSSPLAASAAPQAATPQATANVNQVTGGGAKPTNINISITKLVEKIENVFQNGGDLGEARDIEERLTDAILRAVNSANQAYG